MSQMKTLLNMPIEDGPFFNMLIDIIQNIKQVHKPSLCLSLFCIALLLILRYLKKRYRRIRLFPGPLLIVILGVIISYFCRSGTWNFNIIGQMPSGLPIPTNFINHISWNAFINLFPSSLLIGFVGFIQSYKIAKCADLDHIQLMHHKVKLIMIKKFLTFIFLDFS